MDCRKLLSVKRDRVFFQSPWRQITLRSCSFQKCDCTVFDKPGVFRENSSTHMAKKVKTIIKLTIPAGEATPAPPVGPALGQHGLPIMEFVKAFNEKTADQKGTLIPAVITVYVDRTFSFIVKKPPVAELIKKALGAVKGSEKPGIDIVGTLTKQQVQTIAEAKLPDLNTTNIDAAMKVVAGAARSMGVVVQE